MNYIDFILRATWEARKDSKNEAELSEAAHRYMSVLAFNYVKTANELYESIAEELQATYFRLFNPKHTYLYRVV